MAALEDEAGQGAGRTIAEIDAEIADLESQIKELDAANVGKRFSKEDKERWNNIHARIEDPDTGLVALRDELQLREDDIAARAEKGHVEESTDSFQLKRPGSPTGGDIYDL